MKVLMVFILFLTSVCTAQDSFEKRSNGKIKISLEKDKYSVYEPIGVMVEYTNSGIQNDTLYDIFSVFTDLEFTITNGNNDTLSFDKKFPGSRTVSREYSFIVPPGGTVSDIIPLNEYIKIKDPEKNYFIFDSYLNPGSYKLKASISKDGFTKFMPILESNLLEFKISDASNDDRTIVNEFEKYSKVTSKMENGKLIISRESNFENLIGKYHRGVLNSYIEILNLYGLIDDYEKKITSIDTLKDYLYELINKYPNSYYLARTFWPYLNSVSKSLVEVRSNIQELIQKTDSYHIRKYLRSDVMFNSRKINKYIK